MSYRKTVVLLILCTLVSIVVLIEADSAALTILQAALLTAGWACVITVERRRRSDASYERYVAEVLQRSRK